MFGIGVGIRVGGRTAVSSGGYDPDAQAFFDRVATAGGTLTTTEKNAVNQLVLDMKSAGIWTSMKAVYPMVGASAAACAQNLKSSSFTGTFSSGWTFASTGVTPNGTSAYMDTGLNENTVMTLNSCNVGIYTRTNNTNSLKYDFGVDELDTRITSILFSYNNLSYFRNQNLTITTFATPTDVKGFWQNNRTAASVQKTFFNGSVYNSSTDASVGKSNLNYYLGALNLNGAAILFGNNQYAFCFVSDGLTDTQASNFYTAVQTFNQTLNRQVGAQIVSDTDAQAYINRVYTAGGTLTNTEANAVNQLVIDMKAAGIWTAMKAVYPMVGSSAAACAQNLKSSSFTGTFTSGWTFASTGVTPNGTSAYMDTTYNPNTSGNLNDAHFSVYLRSNISANTVDLGAYDGASETAIYPRFSGNVIYTALNSGTNASVTSNSNSAAFFIVARNSSTTENTFINTTKYTRAITSISKTNRPLYLGAFNFSGTALIFSARQNAFASIGDGLTDTQAADFYTCVQTFNTSLSRQV